MQLQCPCCGEQFPVEAGFADTDGKRLAALFAGLDPKLGRAIPITYACSVQPNEACA